MSVPALNAREALCDSASSFIELEVMEFGLFDAVFNNGDGVLFRVMVFAAIRLICCPAFSLLLVLVMLLWAIRVVLPFREEIRELFVKPAVSLGSLFVSVVVLRMFWARIVKLFLEMIELLVLFRSPAMLRFISPPE